MMEIFADFDAHKFDLSKVNYGIITVIPKGDGADSIQKYMPICL
jgi:hypothetical protein